MTRMRCVPLFVAAVLTLAGSRVQAALPEFTQLVKDVSPSIVNISTTQKVRERQIGS